MSEKMLPVLILALLIGGAGFYIYSPKGEQEQMFCTQEALLCPDGSYVGRTGAQCAFTACPAMDYVEGVLEQNGEGFRLVFDSPSQDTQGVSYSMPIDIQVTNALGQLVGKKVRAYGIFTEGARMQVDHIEELTGSESDKTLGTLGVGETLYINGVRITLNKIVQDSRCPVDVTCIQAGWVTANVSLQSDTDRETRDIRSDQEPIGFDSYLISIAEVYPAPRSTESQSSRTYEIIFRVVTR